MPVSELVSIEPERAAGTLGKWRECVQHHMLPGLDIDSADGNIFAELLAFDFAGARLWFLGSNAQRAIRSKPAQGHTAPVAIFMLEGSARLIQDGRTCELDPGSFAFVDAACPLVLEHPGTFKELYLQFPRNSFRPGDFRRAVAVNMSAQSPLDRPLYECTRNIWGAAPSLGPEEHSAAVDALLSLSLITSAFKQAKSAAPLPVRVERAMAFIEHHLGDENLNAEAVATAQAISRRYLDELFEESGHRIDSWIWERRLQRAATELRMRGRPHKSLLQIALDLGFKDPSHFSRMFARRHGMAPREFRREHGAAAESASLPEKGRSH